MSTKVRKSETTRNKPCSKTKICWRALFIFIYFFYNLQSCFIVFSSKSQHFSNRNVFSFFLNWTIFGEFLISIGSLLKSLGAQQLKALSPQLLFVRGSCNLSVSFASLVVGCALDGASWPPRSAPSSGESRGHSRRNSETKLRQNFLKNFPLTLNKITNSSESVMHPAPFPSN